MMRALLLGVLIVAAPALADDDDFAALRADLVDEVRDYAGYAGDDPFGPLNSSHGQDHEQDPAADQEEQRDNERDSQTRALETVPLSGITASNADGGQDDDSIEAYMNRLLQRVQGPGHDDLSPHGRDCTRSRKGPDKERRRREVLRRWKIHEERL